jgi:hypothetical protein
VIALLVFVCYGLAGSVTGALLYRAGRASGSSVADMNATMGGLFWPVGLWVAVGAALVRYLDRRDERRAERERLARLERREREAALERAMRELEQYDPFDKETA